MATPSKKFLATHLLAFTLSVSAAMTVTVATPPPAIAANQQAALLNNAGVKALQAGDFQTAIQKFEDALKIEPGYSFARDNLAIAYNNMALKVGNPAMSIKYFHKALAISPNNATTSQNLDSVISSMGKDPHNFKDRVDLGKQCRLSSDFDGAIVEFEAALRLKNDGKLHIDLGDVYRVRDRVDDAINQYRLALGAGGLQPTDLAKTHVKLGQAYQAKHDLKDAVPEFGEAVKFNSTDPEVLDALKAGWEEALRENPQAPDNHIGLGQAYELSGDFGMAEAEYKQALMFDHNNTIARTLISQLVDKKRRFEIDKHINAGADLQGNKNYDAAIQEYMIALKADPTNADIFVNIGSALQAKADYPRAISAYQKALQLKPGHKAAQQGLQACQELLATKQMEDLTAAASDDYKAGRYADSLKKYLQLEARTPNDAGVHFNVAAAEQQLNQLDAAIAEYQKAVQLDSKNAEYAKYLETALDKKAQPIIDKAVAAHKDKHYREAVDLYQQAIAIRPKNVELYYDLAGALYSLQDYESSRNQYMKALQLDPKGQVNDLWFLATIDEHYGKGYDAMNRYRQYMAQAPTGLYAKAAKERLDALTKNPNDTVKIKSEDELARIKEAQDAYTAAVKLQQDKRYDEAMPLYQKAIGLQPKESAYPYGLGTLYFAKDDLDNAAVWIDKALTLEPSNKDYAKYKQFVADKRAEKFANDAVAKQNAEDFQSAIASYQKALDLAPKNARLWTNLGSAYFAADNFNDAYNGFKKGIDLDPKNEKANWYSLGLIDENFNRGTQALNDYRTFVATNPGDKMVAVANDRIKALTANARATNPLPTHAEQKAIAAAQAAYDQGVKQQEMKNFDGALDLYNKAHQLAPKEGAYAFAIGSIYQAKNDMTNAGTWYQKAVELSPNNAEFKKYLEGVKVTEAGPIVDEAGKKYTSGDFAGAIELYRRALQIVPNDPSIHTDLASAMQASDDFTGALNEYQTAFKIDPKSQAEDLYFIGALKEHFNRGQEALATYRDYVTKNPNGKFKQYAMDRTTALAKNPSNVVHLQTRSEREASTALQGEFDEAVKLQQGGKYQEADARYADLMQKNPREGAYPFARGTNYQAQNDFVNAVAQYDKAVQLDPTNADYKKTAQTAHDLLAGQIVQQGGQKFSAKDYNGAIELYKQALSYASPQAKANIWTNIGIAQQYSDQFAAARESYNNGYKTDPKGEVDNLYFMGSLDETLGKGQAAFEDYKNYLSYAPKGKYAKEANDRYQVLYYDKTKLQKMQTSTETASLQAANDAYNDGVKLQGENKLDEAIAKYQEALQKSPTADSIWYALGTAYQGKNDAPSAIKSYEKAISLNPKEPSYKKTLSDLKAAQAAPLVDEAIKKQTTKTDKGDYDLPGAVASYEAALRIYDDPSTRMNMGTAYQAMNQYQKALDSYVRALQGDPKLIDAHYYLGTLYEALKKPHDAATEYRKYLQAQPSGQYAPSCKDRLKVVK